MSSRGVEVLSPELDITDANAVSSFVEANEFDVVVHLAAISSVARCESEPSLAFRVNTEGTYFLASAVARKSAKIHFVFPSTGQVYSSGLAESGDHVYVEGDKVTPRNVYALSKYLAEESLRIISENTGMTVTALRVFNHVHKSQRPDFYLASVYRQLVIASEDGSTEAEVVVGNIDIERDFGAIQDLLILFEKVIFSPPVAVGSMNIFNLSSGVGKNLKKLAYALADRMKIKIKFVENPSLKRSEPHRIVAGNDKLMKAYGWAPVRASDEASLVDAFLESL
nr:GDP-mannose 4,6-dehydratase [Bdellovibrio sp. HM001]